MYFCGALFLSRHILNHKAAIELLVEQAAEVGFNRYTILNLHALLSDNLLADSQACGRLRSIPVAIAGTTFHPLEVPQVIEECFQRVLDTAAAIADPFEQAFFAMVHCRTCNRSRSGMDKKVAAAFIKRRASEDVPQEDQARFIEVVETAVMNLHEGNIARYRLWPSQYQKWKETWR